MTSFSETLKLSRKDVGVGILVMAGIKQSRAPMNLYFYKNKYSFRVRENYRNRLKWNASLNKFFFFVIFCPFFSSYISVPLSRSLDLIFFGFPTFLLFSFARVLFYFFHFFLFNFCTKFPFSLIIIIIIIMNNCCLL